MALLCSLLNQPSSPYFTDVANTFIQNYCAEYGLPESTVPDCDAHFIGKFWHALQRALGIELLLVTAFHQVKRSNKTLQTSRIYVNSIGNDWSEHPWHVVCANNFSKTSWYSGGSPHGIGYGHPPV